MDTRDLNYDKYFAKGEEEIVDAEYNSHNTHRLDVQDVRELLLTLDVVQDELKGWNQ